MASTTSKTCLDIVAFYLCEGRKHRSRPSLHAGCLHMYTILPKRYSKRIGAGGWLKVHRNYNDVSFLNVLTCRCCLWWNQFILQDFVEVKKVPERILSADFSKWRNLYITVTIGLALELWGAIAIGAPTICSIIISIAICACIVMLVVMHNAPDQQTRRFSRLFCMFTHIETLVLDNFRISENCSKSRDAIGTVMKSLKGVRIDRLEIRENYMNPYLQCVARHMVGWELLKAIDNCYLRIVVPRNCSHPTSHFLYSDSLQNDLFISETKSSKCAAIIIFLMFT